MLIRFNSLVIITTSLFICLTGCDGILSTQERDNPFDPDAEADLDAPQITSVIINDQPEDSINVDEDHNISVFWEYKYDERLDDIIEGPPPIVFDVDIILKRDPEEFGLDRIYYNYEEINNSEIAVELFNDGDFELRITPSYDITGEHNLQEDFTGDTSEQFITMDVLEEGNITFLPNRFKANVGEEFFIDLWIKEVEEFFAGEFELHFDNELIELTGVNQESNAFHNIENSLAGYHNFNQLVVPDYNDQEQLIQANEEGHLEVSTSLLKDSGNSPNYASGTGSMLRFYYRIPEGVRSGEQAEITIEKDGLDLYNADDMSIDYQLGENASVYID